jgi:hypothetical protein
MFYNLQHSSCRIEVATYGGSNILTIDNSGWVVPQVSPYNAEQTYNRMFYSYYYEFNTKKVLQ